MITSTLPPSRSDKSSPRRTVARAPQSAVWAVAVSALAALGVSGLGCERAAPPAGAKPVTSAPADHKPMATPSGTAPVAAVGAATTRPAGSDGRAADASKTDGSKSDVAGQAAWTDLFDGKSLDGWKVADFAGHGEVSVEDGEISVASGEGLSGIVYQKEAPKNHYEIEVVAKKVDGVDFFSAITFPVDDTHLTFVTGGWGGTVVGISSIDDEDAAHNETTTYEKFEVDKWYTFKVRVDGKKVICSIDGKQVVDLGTEDKKLGLRFGMEPATPLGICSWQTSGGIKSIKLRKL